MPTGYTSYIYDGKPVTFEQYALGVARAFGACVTLRDDPKDADIPDKFEPSDHHKKRIDEAKARLIYVDSWDENQWETKAERAYESELKKYHERLAKTKDLKLRYEAMLAKARAFKPPTPDHEEYAKMLVEQLEKSIEFDCSTKYLTEPTKKTGSKFKAEVINDLCKNIDYHEKEHRKEVERAEKRTAWVRALRESIGNFQPAKT